MYSVLIGYVHRLAVFVTGASVTCSMSGTTSTTPGRWGGMTGKNDVKTCGLAFGTFDVSPVDCEVIWYVGIIGFDLLDVDCRS